MKKILLFMLITSMFTFGTFAQESQRDKGQQKNVLKTNLGVSTLSESGGIGLNTISYGSNLTYERLLTQGISLIGAVTGFFTGGAYGYGVEVKLTPRFYLSNRRTPSGWWVGIPLMFSYRDSTESRSSVFSSLVNININDILNGYINTATYTGSRAAVGGGVNVGYQWIFGNGLAIDLGLGVIPNITLAASDSAAPFFELSSEAIIAIGWAF